MIQKYSLFLFLFFFVSLYSLEKQEILCFDFKEEDVQQYLSLVKRDIPVPENLHCLPVLDNCSLSVKSTTLILEAERMIREIKHKKQLFNTHVKNLTVKRSFFNFYNEYFLRMSHICILQIKDRLNFLDDPMSRLYSILDVWTKDSENPGRANITAFNLYKEIVKERTCFYDIKKRVEGNLFEHSELVDKKIEELELNNKECKKLVEEYEKIIN